MSHNHATGPAEKFVEYALSIGALELVPGGRSLKSGRISPYFFNSGLFCSGNSVLQLAGAYANKIDEIVNTGSLPDDLVLFGPSYKGTFLVPAIAMQLEWKYRRNFEFASNRKEAKDHGEGGIILGASLRGKNVLIVDDVMTTGTSSTEAVEIVEANGGIVVGCMIAFDRQERGTGELSAVQEFQKNFGVPAYPAATLANLVTVLEGRITDEHDHHQVGPILDKIRIYREQYGVS